MTDTISTMVDQTPELLPEEKLFASSEGLNESWSKVREATLSKLLAERPNSDTVDRMMLERVSYLYARIRQKEAMGAFGDDRNYKAAMNLLAQFFAEVRKIDNRAKMMELVMADVVDVVVRGVKESMHDLPPEQQKSIMQNVLTLVHSEAS